uniref:Uncharacterized protein n=1 Tax=Anguilla anguilla TaxID=7936 RepID=A0A0E9VTA0_ANGAN
MTSECILFNMLTAAVNKVIIDVAFGAFIRASRTSEHL